MQLKDRLKLAMEAKRLTGIELVNRVNRTSNEKISATAVSKWLTGKTKTIRSSTAPAVAKVLDVNLEWLSSGKGTMQRETSNLEPIDTNLIAPRKRIPIISFVHAGIPNSSQELADEYVDVSDDVSSMAYGLRVKGDSMEPLFHNGDIIIVDPSANTKPGDYVIARIMNEDESTFKKLRYSGVDENGQPVKELVPLNTDYPTISSNTRPFEICGKVIEHRTFFKNRW